MVFNVIKIPYQLCLPFHSLLFTPFGKLLRIQLYFITSKIEKHMNCGMGRRVNDKTQNFCKTSLGEVLKAESESLSSLNSIVFC